MVSGGLTRKTSDAIFAKVKADVGHAKVLWPEPYCRDCFDSLLKFLLECCWTFDEETS